MGLKFDRFTWGIVLAVLLLIVGAVATVTLTGGQGWQSDEYLNENTPAGVVHDAFLAFVRNDPALAASYYSQNALDEDKYPPFAERYSYYDPGRQNQRLRILDEDISDDKAFVTIAVDHFRAGGLFDSGSTWTNQRTVTLVQEEGVWKIDSPDIFY